MNPAGRGNCAVCNHPLRGEIDSALVAGQSSRALAAKYGMSDSAVLRHKSNHPPTTLTKTVVSQPLANGHALQGAEQVEILLASCLASLDAAKQDGSLSQIAAAHRELRQAIELMNKREAALAKAHTVTAVFDPHTDPRWVSIRSCIMRELEPFPEVRKKVAAALLALDA